MKEHDKTRYQGKRLLYLLVAMLAPAAVLYLSFVFAITASKTTSNHYFLFLALSTIMLILFLAVQLVGARYMQGLLPSRTSRAGKALQYLIAVFTGSLFSICAAMILVALGFNLLARVRH